MNKTNAAADHFTYMVSSAFKMRKTMKPRGTRADSKSSLVAQAKYDREKIRFNITALRALKAVK